MHPHPTTFKQITGLAAAIMRRGRDAEFKRRVTALAQEIDELSAPDAMGVHAFRESIRQHGYDVTADTGMLSRRGVDRH